MAPEFTKETLEMVLSLTRSMLVVLPEVDRLHNFSYKVEERLDNLELANKVDRSSYIAPLRDRITQLEETVDRLVAKISQLEGYTGLELGINYVTEAIERDKAKKG